MLARNLLRDCDREVAGGGVVACARFVVVYDAAGAVEDESEKVRVDMDGERCVLSEDLDVARL